MTIFEFQSWALAQSSVGKYNDGGFPGQCVSLVNQYCYRVLGVPAGTWGDAKDWASDSNLNRQFFDKASKAEAGDIIVYGTDFGGGYGHIGIYLGNGQILDQNGRVALRVSTGLIYSGYIAILRHKGVTAPGGTVEALDENRINRIWLQFLGHAPSKEDISNWTGHSTWELISQILSGQEWATYQKKVTDALAGGSSGYTKVTEDLYRKA